MSDLLNSITKLYLDNNTPKATKPDPENEEEMNKQVGAGLAQPSSDTTKNLKNALGG